MTNFEAQQKIIENNEIIALYDNEEKTPVIVEMVEHLEAEIYNCKKQLQSIGIFAI